MAYEGYKLIRIAREGRIVAATVDAPPINIITLDLYAELARLSQELADDTNALVFVLKSADPDFFLTHFDVSAILAFPTDQPATREAWDRNAYHAMCERFRTMDKVTIAQIEGRVGGGDSPDLQEPRHALRGEGQDHRQPDGGSARHPAGGHGDAADAAADRAAPGA